MSLQELQPTIIAALAVFVGLPLLAFLAKHQFDSFLANFEKLAQRLENALGSINNLDKRLEMMAQKDGQQEGEILRLWAELATLRRELGEIRAGRLERREQ